MVTLVNQTDQKSKRRWITLTEWPSSLLGAYDAGILTGEAELLAKGLKAIYRGGAGGGLTLNGEASERARVAIMNTGGRT